MICQVKPNGLLKNAISKMKTTRCSIASKTLALDAEHGHQHFAKIDSLLSVYFTGRIGFLYNHAGEFPVQPGRNNGKISIHGIMPSQMD
jgi:hypothetical protein